MKALVYTGTRKVSIKDVPDARIQESPDVLVRVTTTNICGSDLHMYEGRTSLGSGRIIGHEDLGEVVERGKSISRVKVGDRVSIPFNVACGLFIRAPYGPSYGRRSAILRAVHSTPLSA